MTAPNESSVAHLFRCVFCFARQCFGTDQALGGARSRHGGVSAHVGVDPSCI
jgi:hypothetical protein